MVLRRFEQEVTLEEYVIAEITSNYGTHTRTQKVDLMKTLAELDIKYNKSDNKEKMLRLLAEHYSWLEIAEKFKVGVYAKQYLDECIFLTRADIKRFEKFGVLKLIAYQEVLNYGKTLNVPVYDLQQYLKMTTEDMKKMLEEYPKGMRKR